MKLLNWIFNVKARHRSGIRRYEKGKVGARVWTVIEMLILVGATVGLEIWCLGLYEQNFIAGIACTILLIAVAEAAIETCGVYSYVGFRMAAVGAVLTVANKIEERASGQKYDRGNQAVKTYKAFDVFIGALGLLLAIGTIAAIIIILYLH